MSRGDVPESDRFRASGGGVVKSAVAVSEASGTDAAGMSFVGELNEASKELSDSERVRERSICDPNEPSYFCARCRLACEPEREASAKSSSFAAVTQSPSAPYDDCRSTVDTAPARVAAYFSKDANAWRHAVAATAAAAVVVGEAH